MLTPQVADFPVIFRVRRTVAEERLAEPFRCSLVGRTCLPEIVGTPCSSQGFREKHCGFKSALARKIERFCLVPDVETAETGPRFC